MLQVLETVHTLNMPPESCSNTFFFFFLEEDSIADDPQGQTQRHPFMLCQLLLKMTVENVNVK